MPLFLARLPRGLLDGFDYVLVACAATVVALQGLPDLLLVRVRVLLEHAYRCHNHARRAIPALQGVGLVERRLHGMPLPILGEALHCGDLAPVGLYREHRTGLNRLLVHQDRTCATV